jgi:hypothetical protein
MTTAEKAQFDNIMAEMKAECIARAAYFKATKERAIAIGNGSANQKQYDAMMALRANWKAFA